ncbi:YozQ family protein [Bacillus tuaregi]|uniref:YozQ family protein n=1 Tax=Bacillus tuaregi TaxID=1816695 RepID=UPI000B1DCB7F|nr:YozQ family protein [Bacillus tuaregi]
MSKAKGNSFKPVNKIYDSGDYEKQNQESQGLAETHEQVSDAYMVGDILTHDPSNQDKGDK